MSRQIGSKKSRRGCKRCKDRRVKCDEKAPCSNCIRRLEDCSLLEPSPSTRSDASDPSLPSNTEDWVSDLELMYHYTSAVALGNFGVRKKVTDLWRDYIPQQALHHTFLLHGLLALAALHLAYQQSGNSQIRYLGLCDKHQAMALKDFRAILSSDISPEQADALFALSAVISISSMARQCISPEANALDMDAIADMFFLTRGVREVIHVHYARIAQGPMSSMFDSQAVPSGTTAALPETLEEQFKALRIMLSDQGLDPEALEHCKEATDQLEDIYRNIAYFGPVSDIEMGQVFRWKVLVPTGYVRLVQARIAPALIILAYYAAVITGIRKAWYTHNFAEYALRGISLELASSMQHWIEWPLQQLQERMAILGVDPARGESDEPRPLLGH